jgi:hypothetical protein
LEGFYLKNNNIGRNGVELICDALKENSNLKGIHFWGKFKSSLNLQMIHYVNQKL